MKGFALDNGDILIQNHQIQMVAGNDLLIQKVQNVLGTNKYEWFLNFDEGINFDNILGKKVQPETFSVANILTRSMNEANEAANEANEALQRRLDGIE